MAKVKGIKLQRIMVTFQEDGEPDMCIVEGWDVTRTDGKKGAIIEEFTGRFAEALEASEAPGIYKAVKAVTQVLHSKVLDKRTK